MNSNPHQYFATLPAEEITGELYSRVEDYFQELERAGHLYKIKKSYNLYYNISTNADAVSEAGDQGELLQISVNHYKAILSQIHTMVTKDRPSLKAQAINSDYKSKAQARLGDGLLDYYLKTQDIEQVLKDAAEMGLVMSSAFVFLRWNPNRGQEYGAIAETGAVIYDGDVEAVAKSCLEVAYDLYSETNDWYVVLEQKNRWDLGAQYPELADEIAGLDSGDGFALRDSWRLDACTRQTSDLIPHYTFIHKPTPSVPNGRQVEFLEGDIVLTDGPLPYRELPIIPIQPGRRAGTQFGDTVAFSLMAIQETIDELYSAIVSNQTTFAVSNIIAEKGSDIDVHELAGGLNLIEHEPGTSPPAALNLTATPPEVFKFVEQLQQQLQLLSGINDVVRGVAPTNLRSGSSLALLAAQALASQSGLNYSYNKLLERTGSRVINLLQDYAKTPRMAVIAGVSNSNYMKEFTGDDVAGVNRVIVEQQSSVMRTTAGRLELAFNLLQAGLFKTPEEYLSVVETGNISGLLAGETSELMLIQLENEELRQGSEVVVIDVDSHDLHIRRHKQVLADPDIRANPEVVASVLNHIQEHITALKTVDPHLLSVVKEQPAPAPQPGQSPMLPPNPGSEDANLPNMPKLPDGTRFDPEGGIQ